MLVPVIESEGKSINKATKRVLQVLAEFIGEQRPLGVSELARRLGMTRNMVHRALVTLNDEGLLHKFTDSGRFILSSNIAELQNAARPAATFRDIARPYMERLVELLQETVQLAVRSGDYQTIIDGIEGRGNVVVRVKLGKVYPLHASVGSRAILAALPDPEIDDYVQRNSPLTMPASGEAVSAASLREDIERIRDLGYAVSPSNAGLTSMGFAYAVPDLDGRPHGAIVVGGPTARVSQSWIREATEAAGPTIAELLTIAALYEAG